MYSLICLKRMAIFANFTTVNGFRGSRFGIREGERNNGKSLQGIGLYERESEPLNLDL